MRLLSEEELDEIFGGQSTSTVVPTLDRVSVTAPRYNQLSGGYWLGGGGGFGQYDESSSGNHGGSWYDCGNPDGTWCRSGVNYPPKPALPSVPTPEKLKCIINAVSASTGETMRTDYRFAVVNSYGYYNESASSLYLSSTMTTPPSGFISINGLNNPAGPSKNSPFNGTTTIYAGGMDGSDGGNAHYGSYYDSAGKLKDSYALGPISPLEEAVLTAGHEVRHQYTAQNPALLGGREKEADARTYGIQALEAFRSGIGQDCK